MSYKQLETTIKCLSGHPATKQTGVICFGGGLNAEEAMFRASLKGFVVVNHGTYAALYSVDEKKFKK
jgi:hypothetical protein